MSPIEDDARRIAQRGRDALIARLRPAFQQAAKAHADSIEVAESELERMVQQAADEADGLQWRRALASVAMEELDLELGDALGHPAVARAHQLIGAPSYEEAVRELGLAPAPFSQRNEEDAGDAEELEEDAGDAEEVGDEDVAEELERVPSPARAGRTPSTGPVRLVCTHIGGIADLASPEPGVELWFSEYGLDIIRPTKEPLGRLEWAELRGIEIVDARGRLALRRSPRSYLVLRGAQGDASFEVHGSRGELHDRLAACVSGKVLIS